MKYLMLIKHPEHYRSQDVPKALMDAMGAFVQEGFKNAPRVQTGSEGALIL